MNEKTMKPCPKCEKEIPDYWYKHDCGWERNKDTTQTNKQAVTKEEKEKIIKQIVNENFEIMKQCIESVEKHTKTKVNKTPEIARIIDTVFNQINSDIFSAGFKSKSSK